MRWALEHVEGKFQLQRSSGQTVIAAAPAALDWLVEFLSPNGMLVVGVDPQRPMAIQGLRLSLEKARLCH